ncbi:MAG: hypothetical protein AB1631_32975 [Acidobacteriota bacterium]
MSVNERRNKLRRRIIAVLRELFLLVLMFLLILTQSRPEHPWNFYSRLLITGLCVAAFLFGLTSSLLTRSKRTFILQDVLMMAWLIIVLGSFWYGPLMVL